MGPAVIGVDVGGTKVAAARIAGTEVVEPVVHPTDLSGADALMAGIESAIREVTARAGEPDAIGIGMPSQIDFATGTIVSSVNIPFEGVALGKDLGARLGVPVYLDNDANCAALAEAQFVGEHPAQHLVMLTLGTGVGGGVVIDGRIFRGATGLGAELGHTVIDADGPECPGTCPNRGCLEALCSGTALEREATARAGGERVKGKQVVAAAREGDAGAQGLLDDLGRWLGIGISNFVNVFEPAHFVIGGGLSAAADLFLETAVAEARSRALPALFERVRVSVAQAGNDAGVIGAGLLAAQELALNGHTADLTAREVG
ncbi:MAG: ROK family protein [Actinomycetota bacterium]|nr:ROK family protein [Actinomycetota bacterium]